MCFGEGEVSLRSNCVETGWVMCSFHHIAAAKCKRPELLDYRLSAGIRHVPQPCMETSSNVVRSHADGTSEVL
jgi:hypothetical protein